MAIVLRWRMELRYGVHHNSPSIHYGWVADKMSQECPGRADAAGYAPNHPDHECSWATALSDELADSVDRLTI